MAPASPGATAEAALTFAMVCDAERAKSLIDDLNKRFPVHTQMQFLLLPPVRAQLALKQGKPSEAVSDLQPASPPIEFALIRSCSMFPVFTQRTFEERPFLPLAMGPLPPPSSRKFSITAELCGTAGQEQWRIWGSRVPTHSNRSHCRALKPTPHVRGQSKPTKPFLMFGKTPILTFLFSKQRSWNISGCSSQLPPSRLFTQTNSPGGSIY
jgi:hypothetical protein